MIFLIGFAAVGAMVWLACMVLAGQRFDGEDRRDEGW